MTRVGSQRHSKKKSLGKRSIVHLLSYVVKCRVTDSQFNTQANCSKCFPSAWMHFLSRVTLKGTAALLMLFAVLRIRWSRSLVFTCGHV